MKGSFHMWICRVVLLGFCLLFILPLLVTVTNAFMLESEIAMHYTTQKTIFDIANEVKEKFISMHLIPQQVTLSQFKQVLLRQPVFLSLFMNSVKITLPVVLGNLVVSTLTAYGFTIWQCKHKEKLFFLYIAVMLMPLQATMVPNYIMADFMGIQDSYLAIILPGIFSPFGVFLMRQSMKNLPEAYFEAAAMDGAGAVKTFFCIVLPQLKSGMAALCMLVYIDYWNLVEQAVIFIKDYYREPLSIYLSRIGEGRLGLVFAASCVYMAVPFWLFLNGRKTLQEGIELSGIK